MKNFQWLKNYASCALFDFELIVLNTVSGILKPVAVMDRKSVRLSLLRSVPTTLLFWLLLWCVFGILPHGMAVPANPQPIEFRQPSGQVIKVYLKGDEFIHWHEDAAGYTILRDSVNRSWVYAVKNASGQLVPTTAEVGRDDPAQQGLPKRLLPDGALKRARALRDTQLKGPALLQSQSGPVLLPRTGTMANLVVLVEFSDLAHSRTKEEFEALFNTIGYSVDSAAGSVKDYYHEVSYDALTVDSVVTDWITLTNNYAYYGANDIYGYDSHPREMVDEALAALEARGFDFSALDNDNDGYVDGLTIIHAGGGEEYSGNDPDYIWSHKWQLASADTYDGKTLHEYHTEPERRGWDSNSGSWGITRIGVICHETGHFLGLPDLYDYGYDSEGCGDFCIMAGGSWNGDGGTQPAHMSAWCKKTLTWLSPTVVTGPGIYSLPRVEDNPAVYQLNGPFPPSQYFLVENRQGHGFDASLPGSSRGIMIWHVDETQPDNDDQSHFMVDVEEASVIQHLQLNQNQGEDSDYFRQGNATEFSSDSTPSNLSYDNVALGMSIVDVSASGSNMTFSVSNIEAPSNFTATATSLNGIDLSWVKNGSNDNVMVAFNTGDSFAAPTNGTSYSAGAALGEATVIYNGAAVAFPHTNLLQGTHYFYRAWSVDGGSYYSSSTAAAASTFAGVPYTESFEFGLGAWVNADGDDGNWTRNAGGTPSSSTGPASASEGSCYLYTEASFGADPGYPDKTACLDLDIDLSETALPALSFYYHMYGADMGSLHVDVFDGIWHQDIWSVDGQQHVDSASTWTQAVVDLSGYVSAGAVRVRIRGITGTGYTSDMAIDNVSFFESAPYLDHFVWSDIPTPQTAGQPFAVEIIAKDQSDSVFDAFTGTVDLSAFASENSTGEIVIGGGTIVWNYPMSTYYHDARTQVIYLDSEIASSCSITSLTLNVSTLPGQTLGNWTIRMRHTSLDSYDTSPSWESDWTTVYAYDTTLTATGWNEFIFDTPFAYNGLDNLMIDFSHNNSSWTSDGFCLATAAGASRSIYYRTDSGYGDPLSWSGTTLPSPYVSGYIPNIRLGTAGIPEMISLTPTISGNFTAGVWAGSLTIPVEAANVLLLAEDSTGHGGISELFNVVGSVVDADGDGIPDWWEVMYFGGPTNCIWDAVCANGCNTMLEAYVAGLNPLDASSVFVITNCIPVGNGIMIEWLSVSGRVYSTLWTDSLKNSFQTLESDIFYPRNSCTDLIHSAESSGFYQIEVEIQ